jgi:hypothetical protein
MSLAFENSAAGSHFTRDGVGIRDVEEVRHRL